MRQQKWLAALAAVLAVGLLAAGCGGDDDETTAATDTAATTTTEDATTTEDEATASEDSGSDGATPDDVYDACIDAVEGTPAESSGQQFCEQARNAFEQCQAQAEDLPSGSGRDTAIQACQDAADQTVAGLQATSGG
jgi:hypothetical protein